MEWKSVLIHEETPGMNSFPLPWGPQTKNKKILPVLEEGFLWFENILQALLPDHFP